ncbi:MAG: hypothetical protein WCQ70_08025 [Lentimicrobiaceae bacterium]
MSSKFAKRFILFLALIMVVNYALDRAFKSLSVFIALNEMTDAQFAEYNDTLKYLAMGNSHNCINTRILENSFNYGSPSENYVQTYYKLKNVLESSGKKPEYLLLQADISSYGPKISDRYEYNSYWIKYINYFELARIKHSRDIFSKWAEGRFFSYLGNYKDIQLSIFYRIKIKKVEMYHGYRPHRDYRNYATVPDKQKVAYNTASTYLTRGIYFDPAIRTYFKMIMDICQKNGVKVVLIRYPMTREFNVEEANFVPVAKLYKEVDEITNGYPVYQGILDYHDQFNNHPDYFFDPDHLNIKGADIFTTQLVKDLKNFQSK